LNLFSQKENVEIIIAISNDCLNILKIISKHFSIFSLFSFDKNINKDLILSYIFLFKIG
jgi:hypothetical protein